MENGLENGECQEEEQNDAVDEETKVEEPRKFIADNLDNRHLIKQIGPIRITSKPPDRPTRHRVS